MDGTFYEQWRENDGLLVFPNKGDYYPAHFHNNIEIELLIKGERKISLNGKTYCMKSGSVAIISGYDVHCYFGSNDENLQDVVVMIPPVYMDKYNAKYGKMRPKSPIINDPETVKKLVEIAERLFLNETLCENVKQAAVDLFFAILAEKVEYVPLCRDDDNILIRTLLMYISSHYKENINLNTVAKALGYTPAHLSRTFHQYFNKGIAEYINDLRIEYVKNKLQCEKNVKTTDILFEAGFGSIQSYYRNRKRQQQNGQKV